MINEYKSWLSDNAVALDNLMKEAEHLKEGSNVLVLGSLSLIPAMLLYDSVKNVHIDAYFTDDEISDDFFINTDSEHIVNRVSELKKTHYDLIFSFFSLNMSKKSSVVPLLFSLEEALNKDGRFLLYLEDSLNIEVGEGKEEKAFFSSCDEIMYKRYMLSDIVQTLSLLNLKIVDIEEVKVENIPHAVAITASKSM